MMMASYVSNYIFN